MLGVLAFVIGASVGSFLNVVADRLPSGRSLVSPRSYCEACNEPLTSLDLVPVLSFLVLRGRCRHCGTPIAARIVAVEAATGVLFLVAYLRGCLKTDLSCSWREDCGASKVAFHEQAELSKRPERPTIAATRTTVASSQTGRPTNQVPSSGGDERYSLCVAHRVRVADAPSRPTSLAHDIPLLPHLAARWNLGEDS